MTALFRTNSSPEITKPLVVPDVNVLLIPSLVPPEANFLPYIVG
jgi:hypothetical protein